jgi:hypothetical protein|tara:strand:- start:273 stop:488 length:216 start_codon:yes stop_codon:yes gene_type:complete
MPQFTLICTDEDQTISTKEFEATILQDVVEKTEDFLRGVGYVFEGLNTEVNPVNEMNKLHEDYITAYRNVE